MGPDDSYRGRELARNAAIGELALATGLRLQEFSYLLSWEVPLLPPKPTDAPIPFPVPAGVDQGPQVPHHLDQLRRLLAAAARGAHPREAGWSRENLAWLLAGRARRGRPLRGAGRAAPTMRYFARAASTR